MPASAHQLTPTQSRSAYHFPPWCRATLVQLSKEASRILSEPKDDGGSKVKPEELNVKHLRLRDTDSSLVPTGCPQAIVHEVSFPIKTRSPKKPGLRLSVTMHDNNFSCSAWLAMRASVPLVVSVIGMRDRYLPNSKHGSWSQLIIHLVLLRFIEYKWFASSVS